MQQTLFQLMPAFLSMSDEDLPTGGKMVDLRTQNMKTDGPTMCEFMRTTCFNLFVCLPLTFLLFLSLLHLCLGTAAVAFFR